MSVQRDGHGTKRHRGKKKSGQLGKHKLPGFLGFFVMKLFAFVYKGETTRMEEHANITKHNYRFYIQEKYTALLFLAEVLLML